MKIKTFSIGLLAGLLLIACKSENSQEIVDSSNQESSTDLVNEDKAGLADNAHYLDQEVIPFNLSAELRDDFVLKSSEVREPSDGILTGTFFNYSLETSNEIAFMFSSTVFSDEGRDVNSHFEGMKANPRPDSDRESIDLIEINEAQWIHDIYTTPGDPAAMKVHNLVYINGAKMFEAIIVTDEPVYDQWEDAIYSCIETLKLL